MGTELLLRERRDDESVVDVDAVDDNLEDVDDLPVEDVIFVPPFVLPFVLPLEPFLLLLLFGLYRINC